MGEEDISPKESWPFNFNDLHTDLILPEYFENNNLINLKDAVVWIDPLDGTLAFLKNELDCVTTLIGLIIN